MGEAIASSPLPAALEAVVRRCRAANPEDRYASATEVLQAFEQACRTLTVPAAPTASQSIVLSLPAVISPQPVDAERPLEERSLQDTGVLPRPQEDGAFDEADYAASTVDIAYAQVGMGSEVKLREKQSPAVADISGIIPGGKKYVRTGHRRPKPLLVVTTLLTIVVLFAMAGLIFFEYPLVASANVTLGPQVHVLQQVYTITAQPSQTGIDVANASIPAREEVINRTSSQTEQTTGQQCNRPLFFRCRQVVTPNNVENLSSQLRQSLIPQLSAEMDSRLQALHATGIGPKQFTDYSESSNPAIGSVSNSVTVTLTEQGSLAYINSADVQQLVRQLLAHQLGPDYLLMNSTVQIGQPIVEGGTDLSIVTMKVAAAGVLKYQYPSTQLQTILSHIKGMARANARAYLRQQPGVDANSVSIAVHAMFGDSNTLPSSASQIKIVPINPTTLPSASLPTLPAPAVSPGVPTPTV